ncbi:MAG: efflux RND transporter periplasmic adaptor subunit [Proteobacteria bacterium]|nr:efflux RND transporter periplasmic adaptor subunit [Pseudomonadota bacterium]
MSRILSLALLIALALAGCAVKDADAVALPPATANASVAVADEPRPDGGQDVGEVASETTADGVPYSGTIEAHRRSTLSPKISSTVAKVHVREGDRVRGGDPLVTFDLRDVNLRLRQARAALEGAKIQREAAEDEWRRIRALKDSQAVSQAQFDGVEFKKRGAEVGVASAEIAVEMGQKAVRDSVVRAPYDGVIVRRMVNEGDYAQTMPPTPLIVIEETGVLDLRILVSSSEMNKIREGDPVAISLPSLGRSIRATVTRIVASVDARTRNFAVIVEIPNPEGALLPGLFAEARFEGAAAAATAP